MRLEALRGRLHGLTYDLALDPLTIVCGENESGKSTLLALAPTILRSQRPSDHPAGLAVEGTWEESHVWVRRSIEGGTHTLQSDARGANGKLKDSQSAIERAVGDAWAWDTAAFLALSPTKRTLMLQDHAILRLDTPREEATTALVAAGVDMERMAVELDTMTYHRHRSAQVALDMLVRELREAWKACNADHRKIQASAERAAETVAKTELPAGNVAMWTERADQLTTKLAELRAGEQLRSQEGRAREAMQRELQQLERERDQGAHTAGLRAHTAVAVEEAVKALHGTKAKLKAAEDDTQAIYATRQTVREEIDEAERELAEATKLVAVAKATQQAYTQLQPVLAPLERVAADNPHHPVGPPEWWKALQEALHALANLQQAQQVSLDELDADVAGAASALKGLQAKRTAVDNATDRKGGALARARSEVARAEHSLQTAQEKLTRTTAAYEMEAAVREPRAQRMAELREQMAAGSASTSDAAAQEASLVAELHTAKSHVGKLHAVSALRADAASRATELQRATERRDYLRTTGAIARTVQGAFLQAAAAPLLEVAKPMVQAVLGAELGLDLLDGARLTLDGQPIEQRSNSAQIIAALSLHVAVVSRLQGWRYVGVDNAEAIEPERRVKLYAHLVDLLERKVIDNAMLAVVGDESANAAPYGGVLPLERST